MIFSAAHTDPYVLEQAYAQDEENEPMTATPGYGPSGRYSEPDEPPPYDPYWNEDEPIPATDAEIDYWRKQNQRKFPPIDPTGDPLDDDDTEPVDASYVTGWDQHGPSYE